MSPFVIPLPVCWPPIILFEAKPLISGVFDTAEDMEETVDLVKQLPPAILRNKSPVLLIKQGTSLSAHIYTEVTRNLKYE